MNAMKEDDGNLQVQSLSIALAGLSDAQLDLMLKTFPNDMKDALARHAAFERNARIFTHVQASGVIKDSPFSERREWTRTDCRFVHFTDLEVDQMVCSLLLRRKDHTPHTPSSGAPKDSALPACEPEFLALISEKARFHLEYYRGVDVSEEDEQDLWYYTQTLGLLLSMTVSFGLVDLSRELLRDGPHDLLHACIDPMIVNSSRNLISEKNLYMGPNLLAVLHANPAVLSLLREGKRAEPLLDCGQIKGQSCSLFYFLKNGVASIAPSRVAELISGVRPEHKLAVVKELNSWLGGHMLRSDLLACVASGLHRSDPCAMAVRLSKISGFASDVIESLQSMACDVDWLEEDEKGLSVAQRCIWHTLTTAPETAPGMMLNFIAGRVDIQVLLLKPDAKGSSLFSQIAKSGNAQALRAAMQHLSSLPVEEMTQAVRQALAHADLRSGLVQPVRDSVKTLLRSWVAGRQAHQALSEIGAASAMSFIPTN